MDRFIGDLRKAVTDLLRQSSSIPVYGYLPDDVAHLPVAVVGRPTISESATAAVMTMTLDVLVLGRRVNDDDAQAELDALADETFDIVGGTRGVKFGDPMRLLSCTEIRPMTVLVAGLEFPAYSFTVDYDILTC